MYSKIICYLCVVIILNKKKSDVWLHFVVNRLFSEKHQVKVKGLQVFVDVEQLISAFLFFFLANLANRVKYSIELLQYWIRKKPLHR